MVSQSAQPALRGTFMSLNGTVQSLSMGLATALAGFLITQDSQGNLHGYALVGYVAVAANFLAIAFAGRLVVR